MFKIEIPKEFLNANCPKCKMRHAPVRDCIDSEGNTLYFDAVFRKGSRVVVFNGTPGETNMYLRALDEEERKKLFVIQGKDLEEYEVDVYLSM